MSKSDKQLSPAEQKAADREQTEQEKIAARPVSKGERVHRALEAYAHAMAHGAPRTDAELAELTELLGARG